MNIMCKLGRHKWSKDCEKCADCGATRPNSHQWEGCQCRNCGKTCHDWSTDCEHCSKCSLSREHPHQWTSEEFERSTHRILNWEWCRCRRCEKTRDEGHCWSEDCEKCAECGKTRPNAHNWTGCECSNCSREKHNWMGSVCTVCGSRKKVMPSPSRADYPRTFSRYGSFRSPAVKDYVAVILSVLESADHSLHATVKQSTKGLEIASLSSLQPSVKEVDALCLVPIEWDKKVPDPKATEDLVRSTLVLGFEELRGTSMLNPWLDALNRVARGDYGPTFLYSVGGKMLLEITVAAANQSRATRAR
jgi:hypothetical protein